jgi:ferric-dicitrate binding protein FerR (iron transport regulator)
MARRSRRRRRNDAYWLLLSAVGAALTVSPLTNLISLDRADKASSDSGHAILLVGGHRISLAADS